MAYSESATGDPASSDTSRYIEQIERYDRGTMTWKEQSEKITKIYLDQHRSTASARRFAMLWSNIETLKPAVYARLPVAVVSRRFKDSDKIGRKAGEMLERCINTTLDLYGANDVLESVRDDRLIAARGQAWVRYAADIESGGDGGDYNADSGSNSGDQIQDGGATTPKNIAPATDKVTNEHVCLEFVHWADFGHSLHRTWPEVTAVWRRVYMTKAAVKKRWPKVDTEKLTFEVRPEYAQRYGPTDKESTEPQAVIYEIWDRTARKTCWIAKEEKFLLESGKPPLNFRGFFPCPRPAYGTHATGSLIPTPDYRYYQDQAEEINDLTEKIASLQEWLVLKAFIPAGPSSEGSDAIVAMLQALSDRASSKGIFVPVESWAGFTEKGGARMIDWLPLDMVIATIKAAIECRQSLINDVYQITGISDILRGETDPNETLGAQEIKAQTGSRRIQTCQRDLARFARDLAEMIGEVIAEVFQPETIAAMSGMDMTVEPPPQLKLQAQMLLQQAQAMAQQIQPPMMSGMEQQPPPDPQAQQAQQQIQQQLQGIQQQFAQIAENKQILALLRDEKTRNFRIEIETDSTIEPDEAAEKQRRVEFVTAMGQFLTQAMPLLQVMPKAAPLIGQTLMFLTRGFRAGRELEDTIEQTMEAVMEQAQQPPPPDPKAAAEAEKMKAEIEFKGKELEFKQAESQQKLQFEQQKHQQDMEFEREKHGNDMQMRQEEMRMQQEQGQIDREMGVQQHQDKMGMAREQHGDKMTQGQQQHESKLRMGQEDAEATRQFERDKIGLPTQEQFGGAVEQMTKEITQVLAGVLDEAKQIKGVVDGLVSEISAPAEIIRGQDGRAAQVRKGKRTMNVRRGAGGEAIGLQ